MQKKVQKIFNYSRFVALLCALLLLSTQITAASTRLRSEVSNRSLNQTDFRARTAGNSVRTRDASAIFTPDPTPRPGVTNYGRCTLIYYVRDQYNNLVDGCRLKISYDDGSGWCEITIMSNTPTPLRFKIPNNEYQEAWAVLQKVMEVPDGYTVSDSREQVVLIDGETVVGNISARSSKPRPTTAAPTAAPTTAPTTVHITKLAPTTTPVATTAATSKAKVTTTATSALPTPTGSNTSTTEAPLQEININVDYVDTKGQSIKKISIRHIVGDVENFEPPASLNALLQQERGYTLKLAETVPSRILTIADNNKDFTIKAKKVYPAATIDAGRVKHKTVINLIDENGQLVKKLTLMTAEGELLDFELPSGYALKSGQDLRRIAPEMVVEVVRKSYLVQIVYVNSAEVELGNERQEVKHGDKPHLHLPATTKGEYELKAGQEVPVIEQAQNLRFVLQLRVKEPSSTTESATESRFYNLLDEDGKLVASGEAFRTGNVPFVIDLPEGYEIVDDKAWQAGKEANIKVRRIKHRVEVIFVLADGQKVYAEKQEVLHGEKAKIKIPEILLQYATSKNITYELDKSFKNPAIKQDTALLVPLITVVNKANAENESSTVNSTSDKAEITTTATEVASVVALPVPKTAETALVSKETSTEDPEADQHSSLFAKLKALFNKSEAEPQSTESSDNAANAKVETVDPLKKTTNKPAERTNSSLFTLLNEDSKQTLGNFPLTVKNADGEIVRFNLQNGDYIYSPNGSESTLFTDANGQLLLANLPDGTYTLLHNNLPLAKFTIDNSLTDPGVESKLLVNPVLFAKKSNVADNTPVRSLVNDKLGSNNAWIKNVADNITAEKIGAKLKNKDNKDNAEFKYEVIRTADGETIIKLKGDNAAADAKAFKVSKTGETAPQTQALGGGIASICLVLYLINKQLCRNEKLN